MTWPGIAARLAGERVLLEPLEPRHEAPLAEAAADPAIWTWLVVDGTAPGAFGRIFAAALAAARAGTEQPFAVLDAADGRALGSTRYLALRPEHGGLEIGWTWYVPAVWRTGVNVEAKLLLLDHAFERLGCARVEFKTDARNMRSRRALEALPARFEGIHRKHMRTHYGVRHSAWFSVLDDEWPAVRANLERRLGR